MFTTRISHYGIRLQLLQLFNALNHQKTNSLMKKGILIVSISIIFVPVCIKNFLSCSWFCIKIVHQTTKVDFTIYPIYANKRAWIILVVNLKHNLNTSPQSLLYPLLLSWSSNQLNRILVSPFLRSNSMCMYNIKSLIKSTTINIP